MRDQLESIEKGGQDTASDPTQKAREQMRRPLPKRFYKNADVGETDDSSGYAVLLDGRVVKTPGQKVLAFPTRDMAALVANEFADQVDVLDPLKMPVFRLANSAAEGVAENMMAVADDLVRFAGSDLLCYRAEAPEGLVENQRRAWDPVLVWLCDDIGADFKTTGGIVFTEQPADALETISRHISTYDNPFQLAAIHSMTTLTGSVMLALAVAAEKFDAETAWSAAHVDEDWNIALWGEDYEARKRRETRWIEMKAAADLFHAARR
ncbi:ATP12 family chaperone protein [Notoacmeibacter sp. MSK16QG-6]|uniref:ATP12 family chaperone protein n=1 Tax=Notoacmeibacter sp. MSK16QG-6 TaxID=2957982 RepID=UPI0020A1599B|nr:ATP12 family protein [Notoacmeibacter sp. MSK16QG-6]MCP1200710.1 ATPase [Notoacmeibacter sp. MSK16QG-6]